jgi:hypothetical protein
MLGPSLEVDDACETLLEAIKDQSKEVFLAGA